RPLETVGPVKNVVAQNERHRVPADERFGYQKRLRDSSRSRLLPVIDREPPRSACSQQLPKTRQIPRSRDQAKLAHPVFNQGRQRVIDHWLVINRLQLLAGDERQREKSRPCSSREYDAFHRIAPAGAGRLENSFTYHSKASSSPWAAL